ncbi:uncharacterized protein E0L32_000684 [Thyridium curvatum]|uniref:Protein kinase domain-containing protein n=1 Tax=Thyridium curvatum TaxID=1093900 RepID=A0A507AYA7_9PEZI|nr:uncharacterized protein E0L32_000684 [Thyridium curvatum]TPX12507.1 hypothetical protein E0L32_000684 [Thyridium curvatum]
MCLCPDYSSRPGLSSTPNLIPPRIELLVVLGRVWEGGETLSLSVASLSIMRAVGMRLTGRRIAHYKVKQKLRTKVLPPHTANKEISHTAQSHSPHSHPLICTLPPNLKTLNLGIKPPALRVISPTKFPMHEKLLVTLPAPLPELRERNHVLLQVNMMSVHYLEEISSGCRDRVSLSIRWNQARLVVHLDPSPTGGTMEDSLIQEYNAACINEDYDEEETMSDRILDAIIESGRAAFDELAPPADSPTSSSSSDLHSLLFPEEFTFRFRTLNNKSEVSLVNSGGSLKQAQGLFQLTVSEDIDAPGFSTKDIRVLQKQIGDGYIAHVLAGGQEMCAKVGDDTSAEAMQRELSTLAKIRASRYVDILRVPKLLGLVQTPEDGRIIGILERLVPDVPELSSLADVETPASIDHTRRKKWASQVEETVRLLHQLGLTWGDGKASNVLIDRDTDDAWVVDFGGGWTDGWVERELSGTVEGDEMALRKIVEWLEV